MKTSCRECGQTLNQPFCPDCVDLRGGPHLRPRYDGLAGLDTLANEQPTPANDGAGDVVEYIESRDDQ